MDNNNNEKIAIYAGSFDPFTLGHYDILKEGSEMFDKIIIAVADNPNKKCMFTVDERINLIKSCIKDFDNVKFDSFEGLTVEYAKKQGAKFLLRGIRSVQDFEYERELAQNNNILAPDIKTVFFMTKPEYSFISSSGVREIILNGGDVSKLVPAEISNKLKG